MRLHWCDPQRTSQVPLLLSLLCLTLATLCSGTWHTLLLSGSGVCHLATWLLTETIAPQ
jgi:hypothetical protein